ncbi:hypothetical protein Bca101_047048 [Brassica carinata]
MLEVVWTTEVFLIKWYSSSINLKIYLIFHSFSLFLSHLNVFGYVFQIWKTSWTYLPVSRLEVVWTSWKSSDKVIWTSRKSSGLPGSRLDFREVVWTSWKSSDEVSLS